MLVRPLIRVRYALRNAASASKTRLDEWAESPSTSYSPLDFLVVHPKIRWGGDSPSALRDPKYSLEEAETLVTSIPSYRVANSVIVGTDYNTKKALIWGEGRLHELVALKEKSRATALMLNVERLTPLQQSELYSVFHCPIFDRFTLVLSLFSLFARDEVARLQIALARIPYLRRRLNRLHHPHEINASNVFLPGLQWTETEWNEEELRMREQYLRKRLKEALEKDEREREHANVIGRSKVAVVGYTNAGKTSLIKSLTGLSSLRPLNRLFATLNTTEYSARLPNGRQISIADTIGFMYDLPLDLLAAFEATLAHVVKSDVVIHVRDVSNPDWKAQNEEVNKTLGRLGMNEEMRSEVIVLDNKIDKGGESKDKKALRISCRTGEGMKELVERLNERVRIVSGCKRRILTLPFNSPSIQWLYREGLVVEEPESTETHLKFRVDMTDEEMERMKSNLKIVKQKTQTA